MAHPALGAPSLKLALGAAAAAAAVALSPGEAKAVLTYNIFQSGNNVTISTSGSLSLGSNNGSSNNICSNGCINPDFLYLNAGPGTSNNPIYNLSLVSATFPSIGFLFLQADSSTGDKAILLNGSGGWEFSTGAASGAAINASSTFNNKTLAQLGFTTPGLIGTWTLTSGGDTIRVVVGAPASAAAAAPGPLPLFGAGAAFAWSRRLRRRIGSAELTASRF